MGVDTKVDKRGKEGETRPGQRPLSNYNFDEAVQKVQEWNEALKCEISFSVVSTNRLAYFIVNSAFPIIESTEPQPSVHWRFWPGLAHPFTDGAPS